MSESEVRKCPKCGGEMKVGQLPSVYGWHTGTKSVLSVQIPKRVFGYACKECGYIELYVEMKEKKK